MPAHPLEEELHRLLERFERQPEGRLFAPLADCYRRLGRLDEAYKVCVDGLARHPRYSTGFVILGKIHLDREEVEEARTAFETVLSIDPENLVALRQLALDAERRGDHAGAETRWEQILGLDPGSREAETRRGSQGGEPPPEEDARDSEAEAPESSHESKAESTSGDTDVALAAGASRRADREGEEESVLEKTSEAAPAAPEVLTAMSRDEVLHARSTGELSQGGDEAETIITVTLADIYYEQGFKAKALEMYRTVMERHPEAAEVAGLGPKVEQIEAEMESLARRFQQSGHEPPEARLEELESGSESAEETPSDEPEDQGVRDFRAWVRKRRKPGG